MTYDNKIKVDDFVFINRKGFYKVTRINSNHLYGKRLFRVCGKPSRSSSETSFNMRWFHVEVVTSDFVAKAIEQKKRDLSSLDAFIKKMYGTNVDPGRASCNNSISDLINLLGPPDIKTKKKKNQKQALQVNES